MTVVSISYHSDSLPLAEKISKRLQGTYCTLSELYNKFGNKAIQRYGMCWDLFPQHYGVSELEEVLEGLRKCVKKNIDCAGLVLESPTCTMVYGTLTQKQVKHMIRCINAMICDLNGRR